MSSQVQCGSALANGQMLYTTLKVKEKVNIDKNYKFAKHHPVDDYLLKQPGTIKRPRNPQL